MDNKTAARINTREAARNRGKRIASPIVGYNDWGRLVCKVCDVTVKSGTLWTAHAASLEHKTAIDAFKARAANFSRQTFGESHRANTAVRGASPSLDLPDEFSDLPITKRPRVHVNSSEAMLVHKKHFSAAREVWNSVLSVNNKPESQSSTEDALRYTLPAGFFDNQDDESRARGVEPVKIDIQDQYDEFRKSIEEDVKEVDFRQEEEEFEAAEDREEHELIEQRNILDRIDLLKKHQRENIPVAANEEVIQTFLYKIEDEELSYESDEEHPFVDWRAKHI